MCFEEKGNTVNEWSIVPVTKVNLESGKRTSSWGKEPMGDRRSFTRTPSPLRNRSKSLPTYSTEIRLVQWEKKIRGSESITRSLLVYRFQLDQILLIPRKRPYSSFDEGEKTSTILLSYIRGVTTVRVQ